MSPEKFFNKFTDLWREKPYSFEFKGHDGHHGFRSHEDGGLCPAVMLLVDDIEISVRYSYGEYEWINKPDPITMAKLDLMF